MNPPQFTTKEELLRELNLSKSTFYRRLKELKIATNGRLISPQEAHRIRQALGFSPQETESDLQQ